MFDKATTTIELEKTAPIGVRHWDGGSDVLFGDTVIRLTDLQARTFLATLEGAYGSQMAFPFCPGAKGANKSLTSPKSRDLMMRQAVQTHAGKSPHVMERGKRQAPILNQKPSPHGAVGKSTNDFQAGVPEYHNPLRNGTMGRKWKKRRKPQ